MRTIFGYIRNITLAILTAILLLACEKEEKEPVINTRLLQSKQWQISHIHELTLADSTSKNGLTTIIGVPVCERGDKLAFQANQVFIRYNIENHCASEEPTQTSTWTVNQEEKIIYFEQTEYEIVALSDTLLELQKEVSVIITPDVYIKKMHRYFYRSK